MAVLLNLKRNEFNCFNCKLISKTKFTMNLFVLDSSATNYEILKTMLISSLKMAFSA